MPSLADRRRLGDDAYTPLCHVRGVVAASAGDVVLWGVRSGGAPVAERTSADGAAALRRLLGAGRGFFAGIA